MTVNYCVVIVYYYSCRAGTVTDDCASTGTEDAGWARSGLLLGTRPTGQGMSLEDDSDESTGRVLDLRAVSMATENCTLPAGRFSEC